LKELDRKKLPLQSLAPDLEKLLQQCSDSTGCEWDLEAVGMQDLPLDRKFYVGHLLGGGAEFSGASGGDSGHDGKPLYLVGGGGGGDIAPLRYSGGEEVGTVHRQFATEWWTLAEVLAHMRACYADTVAVEFNHITDRSQRLWLQQRVEVHMAHRQPLTRDESLRLLQVQSGKV
jgi:hypothetical protein